MRALLLVVLAFATAAMGQQKSVPLERMTEAQRGDYRKLMSGYINAFRLLGRSKLCRLDFDAEPYFRELAWRHGEASEPMRIARLAYTAGAEKLDLPHDIDPSPPAPMPCDVMVYMRDMQLPELPRSLSE